MGKTLKFNPTEHQFDPKEHDQLKSRKNTRRKKNEVTMKNVHEKNPMSMKNVHGHFTKQHIWPVRAENKKGRKI
jgi:hypothetical protein